MPDSVHFVGRNGQNMKCYVADIVELWSDSVYFGGKRRVKCYVADISV